jgi:phytoene synthase
MSLDLIESYRFCKRVARREARNFYPSFLLLPADRRRSMCALYAFLRQSDDIADEPSTSDKYQALESWRAALDEVLDGGDIEPDSWPGWPALEDTVDRWGIPAKHLHAVLDGVALDLDPKPIATSDELDAYCDLVASAVGLCCLHIWGFRSEEGRAEALAECTGRALQLTNIIRDVKEDALNHRVYLPQADLARFGVSVDDLTVPHASEPLRRLLAFEGRRAYDYYDQARPLAGLVNPVGRPVLAAIVGIYHALLDRIAGRGYDVLVERVSIGGGRKAAIAMKALASRFVSFDARGVEAPPVR